MYASKMFSCVNRNSCQRKLKISTNVSESVSFMFMVTFTFISNLDIYFLESPQACSIINNTFVRIIVAKPINTTIFEQIF